MAVFKDGRVRWGETRTVGRAYDDDCDRGITIRPTKGPGVENELHLSSSDPATTSSSSSSSFAASYPWPTTDPEHFRMAFTGHNEREMRANFAALRRNSWSSRRMPEVGPERAGEVESGRGRRARESAEA